MTNGQVVFLVAGLIIVGGIFSFAFASVGGAPNLQRDDGKTMATIGVFTGVVFGFIGLWMMGGPRKGMKE